jgi:hypothetical protein
MSAALVTRRPVRRCAEATDQGFEQYARAIPAIVSRTQPTITIRWRTTTQRVSDDTAVYLLKRWSAAKPYAPTTAHNRAGAQLGSVLVLGSLTFSHRPYAEKRW